MKECLIIVESPTKEKVLKEMLGNGFQISSSKGHVKDLPKSRLGIDTGNHFKPTWIVIPGKRQIIKKLKKLAIGKEKVFLATDPDREGEAISWHIAKELNIELEECRVVFNEITKNVVKEAVCNPRKLNMNIVESQITRRLLDRLVGYKVSPLCYRYTRGKSAGRVQSVAVHLIVKRQNEIDAFVPEEFWKVNAHLLKKNDQKTNSFETLLVSKSGKKINIKNKTEAETVCKEIKKNKFIVSNINKKMEKKHSPLPFKTSSLQQTAYNNMKFSVKRTMRIAQQLYEGIYISGHGTIGLITYMRTDSNRISEEAKINARKYIKEKIGNEYVYSVNKKPMGKSKNDKKKIQDAHEAIRPTSVQLDPESVKNDLTNEQFKLYQLIWKRFIASQMKSATFERNNVKINSGEYIFEINSSKIIFPGFLKIYDEGGTDNKTIPKLQEGEELKLLKIDSKQSFTKPPARYNEASLVKVLEKEGIGRPSTYSVIIDKIQSRGYVEKENRNLKPTKLGVIVDHFLIKYFSNIINIKFTANMESKLDKIESGEQGWEEILDGFYQSLLKDINNLDKNPPDKLIQQSREYVNEKCSVCGSKMEIKNGPYGKYLACSELPVEHPTKPFIIKTGISCPKENCDGEIIKLKSKKGKVFYGCSRYPDCDFYSNHKPVDKKCLKCGTIMVEINSKKNGIIYKCNNKECDYSEKAR